MNICKKCNSKFDGNYCPICGHPQKLARINGRYILSEIASVLNFQKGFLYTVKELLIRPGENIREFLSEDRNRLMKPVMFILINSLIYTIVVSIFNIEEGYINGTIDVIKDKMAVTLSILKWVKENYGYSNIIMAVFISMWLKFFFRKYAYNFFEILILLCFIMGVEMLIYTVFVFLHYITHTDFITIGLIMGFVYTIYAIGQFFDKKKISNYVKVLISYILGFLSFTFVTIGIGVLIDLFLKYK